MQRAQDMPRDMPSFFLSRKADYPRVRCRAEAVKFRPETLEASGRENQSCRNLKHHGRRLFSLICTISHKQFVDELITFMAVRYLVV